ncbi:MAG: nucleoside-diphosphate sugar epimerase, partial [Verrucomicrobiota bacterium]
DSKVKHVIIKSGMNYGIYDHFLHHLSRALRTFPVIALLGIEDRRVRPIAVEDLLRVFKAALYEERLDDRNLAVMGPEELTLSEVIHRVAGAVERKPVFVRFPFFIHRIMARFFEWFMRVPLVSRAQVEIFSEGLAEPAGLYEMLPEDLQPRVPFSIEAIRSGLPAKKPFGLKYCLVCIATGGDRTGRCPVREHSH